MATHSSILAWEFGGPRRLTGQGPWGTNESDTTALLNNKESLWQEWKSPESIKEWKTPLLVFSSVQFSRSVVSDSLQPHEPQHARPPCPSPTPGVHPHPCPSSRCWT